MIVYVKSMQMFTTNKNKIRVDNVKERDYNLFRTKHRLREFRRQAIDIVDTAVFQCCRNLWACLLLLAG